MICYVAPRGYYYNEKGQMCQARLHVQYASGVEHLLMLMGDEYLNYVTVVEVANSK